MTSWDIHFSVPSSLIVENHHQIVHQFILQFATESFIFQQLCSSSSSSSSNFALRFAAAAARRFWFLDCSGRCAPFGVLEFLVSEMLCAIPTSYSFSFPRCCAPFWRLIVSRFRDVVRRLRRLLFYAVIHRLLFVGFTTMVRNFFVSEIFLASMAILFCGFQFRSTSFPHVSQHSWGQGLRAHQGRAIAASEPTIGKTEQWIRSLHVVVINIRRLAVSHTSYQCAWRIYIKTERSKSLITFME